MYKKGFSLQVQGANAGVLRPLKSITNMPSDEKYKKIILDVNTERDVNTKFKEFLQENLFQGMVEDSQKLLEYYMRLSILNNLYLLDFKDKNGSSLILSNTNVTFSYYPFVLEYNAENQEKIKKYSLELSVLERISSQILDIELNYELLQELFLELVACIRNKSKNYQSNNPLIVLLSDLKLKILTDGKLIQLVNDYKRFKIHLDVNKQGSTSYNNVFYNSPVFLSEQECIDLNEFKIENFGVNLPNVLQTSICSLHPVSGSKFQRNHLEAKDVFKFYNYYKKIVNIFDIDTKDSVILYVLENFLKLEKESGLIYATIKQNRKEILMKTGWFEIGEQISMGVNKMHENKRGPDYFRAIASTKEELVNNISMKRPSTRSDLIIKKYIVKFQLSQIRSNNPEEMLEMSDDGLKEFILGLYCKSKKEEV